jgi:hypothetical protein
MFHAKYLSFSSLSYLKEFFLILVALASLVALATTVLHGI